MQRKQDLSHLFIWGCTFSSKLVDSTLSSIVCNLAFEFWRRILIFLFFFFFTLMACKIHFQRNIKTCQTRSWTSHKEGKGVLIKGAATFSLRSAIDMPYLHQLSKWRILQVFAWIQEMYFSLLNEAVTKDYHEEKVSKIYTEHSRYYSTQLIQAQYALQRLIFCRVLSLLTPSFLSL